MTKPVTETFVANWRPTVRFHRHSLDVLDGLEHEGLLRHFRVANNEIGARTDDAELVMHAGGATIRSRVPLLSGEISELMRLMFASVVPPHYEYSLLYQYLVPISDHSYDEARQLALAQMSRDFFEGLGVVDFAMLLDGSHSGSEWNCEFGVVSEEEIDSRLRREVGRVRYFGGSPWIPSDLPTNIDVAFFADFVWRVPLITAPSIEDSVDDLVGQMQGLWQQSADIVKSLYSFAYDRTLQASGGKAEL